MTPSSANISLNSRATSGILPNFAESDLSDVVLGVQRTREEGLLLLGKSELQFGIRLAERPGHHNGIVEISVFEANKQTLWVTAHDGFALSDCIKSIQACIESGNISPLQEFLKTERSFSSVSNAYLSHLKNRELFDRIAFCNQFRDCTLPAPEEFKSRIAALPYMDLREFGCSLVESRSDPESIQIVPVKRILGTANSDGNWLIRDDRGEDYLYSMAQNIVSANLLLPAEHDEIGLLQIGDAYFVTSNGRHRVAALKGLGSEDASVIATVRTIQFPREVTVFSRAEISRLEERQNAGLISGLRFIKQPYRVEFAELFATLYVEAATHPWAFAKDIDAAEKAYKAVTQ